MEYMVILNDKWALDGCDPNSYSGIGWVCGKFDRAWTERDIFGKVRFMASANTAKKFQTGLYVSV
jgi:deoxyribodipyrimidine photo-lyase